jgi:hypothetical protein
MEPRQYQSLSQVSSSVPSCFATDKAAMVTPIQDEPSRMAVPWRTFWREFRIRALPLFIFGLTLAVIVLLWPGAAREPANAEPLKPAKGNETTRERKPNENPTVERLAPRTTMVGERSRTEVSE